MSDAITFDRATQTRHKNKKMVFRKSIKAGRKHVVIETTDGLHPYSRIITASLSRKRAKELRDWLDQHIKETKE